MSRNPPTTPADLAAAIRAACAARGDSDANRAALLAECLQLDATGQADMLDHFRTEAARWAGAGRSAVPGLPGIQAADIACQLAADIERANP